MQINTQPSISRRTCCEVISWPKAGTLGGFVSWSALSPVAWKPRDTDQLPVCGPQRGGIDRLPRELLWCDSSGVRDPGSPGRVCLSAPPCPEAWPPALGPRSAVVICLSGPGGHHLLGSAKTTFSPKSRHKGERFFRVFFPLLLS